MTPSPSPSPDIVAMLKKNPTLVAVVVLLLAMWFFTERVATKVDTITPCVCPGMAVPQG